MTPPIHQTNASRPVTRAAKPCVRLAMRLVLLAALFCLTLPSYAQHHPVYTGKVVRILDGKTLQIDVRSRDIPANTLATAQLWGIDLSKDKKHVEAAKKLLTKLALNRNVHVDVYGEEGDWVQTEGSKTSLSASLVAAGLASRWRSSGIRDFEHHEKELESAEKEAKEKKLGIWKSARQKPATGYAPVDGLKMYYEVHGSGEPVVLLHGAFMTISNNGTGGSASSPRHDASLSSKCRVTAARRISRAT